MAPSLIQISARLPGRVDRGVEINAEISALLTSDAPVAIGVSGGKDSCAAAIATVEHLRAIGHLGEVILIHADLGDPDPALDVEWSDSLPTCERLAAYLGLDLLVVRRPAGGMMKRWQKRHIDNLQRYIDLSCVKVIPPWSTPDMRFCTSELKSAPMASGLVRRFRGHRILSACGVRREESKTRSKAPTCKENKRLTNAANRTSGLDWNPIAHWTESDVFSFCASRGFRMHDGYAEFSMSRISCRFCMMAKLADLVASASNPKHWPLLRTMVGLEIVSTFSFQGARWLADVAPHVLDEETRAAVADAKRRATERETIEARIPDHLLYEKGWPKVMPTWDEAIMLGEVRIAMSALLGVEARYITPQAIIDRYAGLMAENARREAAKAAKAARKTARTTRTS